MTRKPEARTAAMTRLGVAVLLIVISEPYGRSADITDLSNPQSTFVCVVDLVRIRQSQVVTELAAGDSIVDLYTKFKLHEDEELRSILDGIPEKPALLKFLESTDTIMIYKTNGFRRDPIIVFQGQYETQNIATSLEAISVQFGMQFKKKELPDGTLTFLLQEHGPNGSLIKILPTGQIIVCDVRDREDTPTSNHLNQRYNSKSRTAKIVDAMRKRDSVLIAAAEVYTPSEHNNASKFDVRRWGVIQEQDSLMFYADVRHELLMEVDETHDILSNHRNALVNTFFDLPIARIFHESEVEVDDKIVRLKIQIPNQIAVSSFSDMVRLQMKRGTGQ
ncbi:hypothetical protein [Novipirellula sp.]|uniref:hypothetical protein n=1 Tax=Novipirellula sp. TaxID=2795430 RepID=UPI0035655DF1